MAETLVIVPDMMCDARGWATITTVLSYDRPVLFAPVWNGDRIEEIASAILTGSPSKFALLGHGLGGVVALEMFRRAPDRVVRLALMGTNLLSDTPQEAAAREPQIIGAKSGRFETMLKTEILPRQVAGGPRKGALMSEIMEMALALGPDIFARQMRAMQRRRDQQSTVRRITQPTLVLGGALDEVVTPKRQDFLADLIPYAERAVLDDVGHWPMLEDPEAVLDALNAWMRQPLVLRKPVSN